MAKPKQSGSALLWILIWLTGMAAIAFFCLIRHLPTLELATENRLKTSLSTIESEGIESSVQGYTATLSGDIKSESQKQEILAKAAATPGVKQVIDNMAQSGVQVAKADDTTPLISAQKPVESKTATATATATDDKPTADADTEEPATEPDVAQTPTSEPVVQTEVQTTQVIEPTQSASMNLQVDDGTLLIDGQLAETDDIDNLIDRAKATLNIDFVSNSTEAKQEVVPTTWIRALTAFIPTMATLENPGIQIKNNQIALSGVAPDQKTHDAVINRALQLLGRYSLIERIDITEATSAPEVTAEIVPDDAANEPAEVAQTTPAENKTDVEAQAGNPDSEAVSESTETSTPDTTPTPSATQETNDESQSTQNEAKSDSADKVRAAFAALPSKRILFKSSNAILTTDSQTVLDDIAQLLKKFPDVDMDINGHTDASGDTQTNLELSQERANAVRDYLIDQGISVYRLTAYGFGEGVPIATNDTPEGRALNRRIEFKF